MAVYQILQVGDPLLRMKSAPVKKVSPNIIKLLENLKDTMYAANGVGLAAPQIGVLKRVVVVDVGEGLVELINPVIKKRQGRVMDVEGCLSIPGIQGEVPRAQLVEVEAWDRQGCAIKVQGEDFLARALQHEIDHLDGILFIDKAVRLTEVAPYNGDVGGSVGGAKS